VVTKTSVEVFGNAGASAQAQNRTCVMLLGDSQHLTGLYVVVVHWDN
jgi:hypothetical protein